MYKKYRVVLTESQRNQLEHIYFNASLSLRVRNRAKILLDSDLGVKEKTYTDKQISQSLGVSVPTIERTRKCFVQDGLAKAIYHRKKNNNLNNN